jgi:hypothetical protein
MRDLSAVAGNIVTRLTGGSVAELEVGGYYTYEFNVAGEGRFTLAARPDGATSDDLESREFDSGDVRRGRHSERSFSFKVPL